jgi:hypothetical protein
MRKLLIVAVVLFIGVSQASAAFQWNQGVIPGVGDIMQIDLINKEVVVDGATGVYQPGGVVDDIGDKLFGIAKITGIHGTGVNSGTTYWSPSPTQEIALVFRDYVAGKVPTLADGSVWFTGGVMDWYFDSTPDYSSSTGPFSTGWTDIATDNGVGNSGDTLWFTTDAIAGRDSGFPAATLVSRDAELKIVNGTELYLSGVGHGLLEITSYSSTPHPFEMNASFLFDNDFTTHSEFGGTYTSWESQVGWSLDSQDPAYPTYVPEPASIIVWGLLGAGCAGGVMARRRRRRAPWSGEIRQSIHKIIDQGCTKA